jgi:carbon starvation protein
MNGLWLIIIAVAVLSLAYVFYGRFLARLWGIDPNRKTPAYTCEDGVDYVPTIPVVTFGHQFASIVGISPLNGPIIAAMFGWLPAFLWLILGSVFFGALHDFVALYTSIRNQGKSIGYCLELYVGKTGKRLFLLFSWVLSILIAAAFIDIAAETFDGFHSASGAENAVNASVATASILFTVAAIFLGFLIKKRKLSGAASVIIAVDLLIVCIVGGNFFPIYGDKTLWLYVLFGFVILSASLPIWVSEQSRNYLNSFLLVALVVAAFIGIVSTAPKIELPAFTAFKVNGNYLFPGLFITIACGAISGFHSMVATGATSKQLINEKYMLPVSYGCMLLETIVGVIALIAVGSLAVGGKLPEGTPTVIFARGVSGFLSKLKIPVEAAFTIVSLSVSSFVLTTLNSVVRLGRIAFQELCAENSEEQPLILRLFSHKVAAVLLTIGLTFALVYRSNYATLWSLFGASNQMLATLSLIACAVFLKKTNRRFFPLIVPIVVMLIVTTVSLIFIIRNKINLYFESYQNDFYPITDAIQLAMAGLLLVLSVRLVISCAVKIFEKRAA